MKYRNLGGTGMRVSEVSLGTWAFGSEWGAVSDEESYAALNRAIDLGVNFLASGLLSGKMTADREFSEEDHRNFDREGQAFDRGETFSGIPFETGLEAAEELKELIPEGHTLAQLALRFILMHPAVSCAIPGAKCPDQVEDNLAAAELPPLSEEAMDRIREIYDHHVRPEVHHLW